MMFWTPRRTVVQFDFRGARKQAIWLVLEVSDISVCLQDPGFEVDLLVHAEIAAFYKVWLGRISLGAAVHAETGRPGSGGITGAPERATL